MNIQTELFESALCIAKPLYISNIEFNELSELHNFKSRLTAGLTEGINSRIQEIKHRAKGFRNIDYFISMIYVEVGNLKINTIC